MKEIIRNERMHISETEEVRYCNTPEHKALEEKTQMIFKEIASRVDDDTRNLLDDFLTAAVDEWVDMDDFYFERGVVAGASTLNFIKEIDGVTIGQAL